MRRSSLVLFVTASAVATLLTGCGGESPCSSPSCTGGDESYITTVTTSTEAETTTTESVPPITVTIRPEPSTITVPVPAKTTIEPTPFKQEPGIYEFDPNINNAGCNTSLFRIDRGLTQRDGSLSITFSDIPGVRGGLLSFSEKPRDGFSINGMIAVTNSEDFEGMPIIGTFTNADIGEGEGQALGFIISADREVKAIVICAG